MMEAETAELEFAENKPSLVRTPKVKNELEDSFANFTGRMRYDFLENEVSSERQAIKKTGTGQASGVK